MREWFFKCKVCGEEVHFGEDEAYELLHWSEDDDAVQVVCWHARCLTPEQIKKMRKGEQ